jgi:hypothetical protein
MTLNQLILIDIENNNIKNMLSKFFDKCHSNNDQWKASLSCRRLLGVYQRITKQITGALYCKRR